MVEEEADEKHRLVAQHREIEGMNEGGHHKGRKRRVGSYYDHVPEAQPRREARNPHVLHSREEEYYYQGE